MLTIITQTLSIIELVDKIHKELQINQASNCKIKIEINFYDERGEILKPFYFITRKIMPKYKLYTYIQSNYNNYIQKLGNPKISKYEINIIKF